MTEIDTAEWIRGLDNTDRLLSTFLVDGDAGLELLMGLDPANDMLGVVACLLGFIRSDVYHHLRADPTLTLEQIITDIRIGFLEQRAELDT